MTMKTAGTRRLDGLGIYTVIYLVFIYGPVLVLPVFSFNDSIYVAFPLKGFTFQWYQDMANNPGLLAALWNSVKLGAVVSLLSTILGTLAAHRLQATRRRKGEDQPGDEFYQ